MFDVPPPGAEDGIGDSITDVKKSVDSAGEKIQRAGDKALLAGAMVATAIFLVNVIKKKG